MTITRRLVQTTFEVFMKSTFALIALFVFITGCSEHPQAKDTTKQDVVATPVAFNLAGAPTVEFNAPDMMCPDGCGEKVKEVLLSQPGAKEVLVEFDAKKVKVAIDDTGKFDAKAAVAALVDHGFANSSIAGSEQVTDPKSAGSTESDAKNDSAG
jgi:copper chaperone CopZ